LTKAYVSSDNIPDQIFFLQDSDKARLVLS